MSGPSTASASQRKSSRVSAACASSSASRHRREHEVETALAAPRRRAPARARRGTGWSRRAARRAGASGAEPAGWRCGRAIAEARRRRCARHPRSPRWGPGAAKHERGRGGRDPRPLGDVDQPRAAGCRAARAHVCLLLRRLTVCPNKTLTDSDDRRHHSLKRFIRDTHDVVDKETRCTRAPSAWPSSEPAWPGARTAPATAPPRRSSTRRSRPIRYAAVIDANEATAADAAERYGYERHGTDWRELLEADDVQVVSVVVANAPAPRDRRGPARRRQARAVREAAVATRSRTRQAMADAAAAHPDLVTGTALRLPPPAGGRRHPRPVRNELGEVSHFNGRYWCDYARSSADPDGLALQGRAGHRRPGRHRQPPDRPRRVRLRADDPVSGGAASPRR